MDLDQLFEEGSSQPQYQNQANDKYNLGDDLTREVEAEYTGKNTIRLDRMKERDQLKQQLSEAEKKLRGIKNPRAGSASRRQTLTKLASERREKLKKKIARIKVRLDELAIECGESTEAEKKEQLEEARTKKSDPRFGNWANSTPYDDF